MVRLELMLGYISRRLALGALTVVGVSIVVFVSCASCPAIRWSRSSARKASPSSARPSARATWRSSGSAIRCRCNTCDWMKDIARGNFGRSFFRSESVAEMILRRGPLTAQIAFLSVVLSWVVGIPVAIVSALRPNSLGDNVSRFSQHPVPRGARLLAGHADRAGAAVHVRLPGAADRRRRCSPTRGTNLQMVIGPAIVLGLGQAAYIARMARSSLLEVIREDYVRTARAKGLNRRAGDRAARAAECAAARHHAVGHPARLRAGRLDPGRARLRHAGARLRHVHRGQRARRLRHAEPGVPLCRRLRRCSTSLVDIIIAWLDPRIRFR